MPSIYRHVCGRRFVSKPSIIGFLRVLHHGIWQTVISEWLIWYYSQTCFLFQPKGYCGRGDYYVYLARTWRLSVWWCITTCHLAVRVRASSSFVADCFIFKLKPPCPYRLSAASNCFIRNMIMHRINSGEIPSLLCFRICCYYVQSNIECYFLWNMTILWGVVTVSLLIHSIPADMGNNFLLCECCSPCQIRYTQCPLREHFCIYT